MPDIHAPHAPRGGSVTRHTEEAICCCWLLNRTSAESLEHEQLLALYDEIGAIQDLLGGNSCTIESSACSGVIKFSSDATGSSPTVDRALRFSQLLCRWAGLQEKNPIGLRVGVHKGLLYTTKNARNSLNDLHYGPAINVARVLADTAPKDLCVHMLPSVKGALVLMEKLPFYCWFNSVFSSNAYYLDPWVHAGGLGSSQSAVSKSQTHIALDDEESTRLKDIKLLPGFSNFVSLLEKHKVDTSKFGVGKAKSLQAFHRELQEGNSYLVEREGSIERRLELVRVNFVAKDKDGNDRFLKISCEVMEDGRTRQRDQKLGGTVPQDGTWQQAVQKMFAEKFKISAGDMAVIQLDGNWYKEERALSPSIPGIPTNYIIHEVRYRVTNPQHPALTTVGLPGMQSFMTKVEEIKDGVKIVRQYQWVWVVVGKESAQKEHLQTLLQEHNVCVLEFDHGALDDLVDEIYKSQKSKLAVRDGELLRYLQVIKVNINAEIFSVSHTLFQRSKIQKGKTDHSVYGKPLSMRMNAGAKWKDALSLVFYDRLGLDETFIKENVLIDEASYSLSEEVDYSRSYPGLKTVYRVNQVTCQILSGHGYLGLPDGSEFTISRTETSTDGGYDILTTSNFMWQQDEEVRKRHRLTFCRAISDKNLEEPEDVDEKRALPCPQQIKIPKRSPSDNRTVLEVLMEGKKTDWERARIAARRIRDADYTTGAFLRDCEAAFPELTLYMVVGNEGETDAATTSGRTCEAEYLRTIGALFAFFWLMRVDIDGKELFSYGTDKDWTPLRESSTKPRRPQDEIVKRVGFFHAMPWKQFPKLFTDAGFYESLSPTNAEKGVGLDTERVLAMLVLTAIHDIMKVAVICPTVASGEFRGYKAGEQIGDHDIALGYVLEHHPNVLPSFAGLPKVQQEAVKFTQSKMDYNMGWLVQAEAPPGALFKCFKSMIMEGQASQRDTAFYFTHWLTDLAGAEPFPQEGCEKFVLKFPMKVLASFLDSFGFVQKLTAKSESEVYQEYIDWRWTSEDDLKSLPSGPGSIAKLRLVIMAQGNHLRVLEAFDNLDAHDSQVLSSELARTGCVNQKFQREETTIGGPAILVYYAPALLQKNCARNASGALHVLAEVFRKTRELWPLEAAASDDTITVRIDALKELDVGVLEKVLQGEFWALEKTSGKDAVVKKYTHFLPNGSRNIIDWTKTRPLMFSSSEDDELIAAQKEVTTVEEGDRDIYADRLIPIIEAEIIEETPLRARCGNLAGFFGVCVG